MPEILVVDDSATDRRIAGGLLEKQGGWCVGYAGDGQEALDKLQTEVPDLILTDLQMPNVNGLEVVETVKREFPIVPVFIYE